MSGKVKNRNEQLQKPQGIAGNKFWNFKTDTETKVPELFLYGPISGQQSWIEDRVTPQQFNKELDALGDVPEIVVRINSGGGDVFAANAIFTRLKDHTAKITVKIDGWAASAATIIAMAGDVIKIARNGVFMIHDPALIVCNIFKAEDFEKMACELKVIKQSIVSAYAMKTGIDVDEIAALMSEEKWWTGDEAVANGFCDELMFEEVTTVIENATKIVVNSTPIDISIFKTLPEELLKNSCSSENVIKKENNIKTAEELKATYPEFVAMIEHEAIKKERNRIKKIEDMASGKYANLVYNAKFIDICTAEQAAMKIVSEQTKQGNEYLQYLIEDAEISGANQVAGMRNERGMGEINLFDIAINKLKFDFEEEGAVNGKI